MAPPTIKIEGLTELRREVRQAKEKTANNALRDAHRSIAKIVAADAADRAPKRSGRLSRSVKGTGSTRDATIKAGTASRVPYANVIHFGWPRRNIGANLFMFDAVEAKADEIRDSFEEIADGVREAIEG